MPMHASRSLAGLDRRWVVKEVSDERRTCVVAFDAEEVATVAGSNCFGHPEPA
jgi:hypothetical protein